MISDSASHRLRQAIILNDLSLVQRILNTNPALLYNPVFNGKADTSLHLAASIGAVEIVRHLIDLGHDSTFISTVDSYGDEKPNHGISINTDGQSPLHVAASNLHTPVVEILCVHFPSTVNRKDRDGRTPLLLAAGAHSRAGQSQPVTNSKPTVRPTEDVSTIEILLEYGADVMSKDHRGNTCLHNACAFGNLKAIRALVQAGADPACMNFEGWKPELYSLTVQAEVYYRNLVNEFGKQKAEEEYYAANMKGKGGGGGVRIVAQNDDDDDDTDSTDSQIGRSRADSGRSQSTFASAMS